MTVFDMDEFVYRTHLTWYWLEDGSESFVSG
jgi:hypothetical protein